MATETHSPRTPNPALCLCWGQSTSRKPAQSARGPGLTCTRAAPLLRVLGWPPHSAGRKIPAQMQAHPGPQGVRELAMPGTLVQTHRLRPPEGGGGQLSADPRAGGPSIPHCRPKTSSLTTGTGAASPGAFQASFPAGHGGHSGPQQSVLSGPWASSAAQVPSVALVVLTITAVI